jgi:uncharacterized BrkB/YihY/UPF0761 family membrane protein
MRTLILLGLLLVTVVHGNIFTRVWNGDDNDWDAPSAAFWVVIGCAAFLAILMLGFLIYWWCRPAPTAAQAIRDEARFQAAPYVGVMNKFAVTGQQRKDE